MNPNLFIVSITAYLLSIVGTLTGSFFSKFVSAKILNVLFVIHLGLLLSWFIFRSEAETVLNPGTSNYLFLAFTCSGILVSAIVLRKNFPVYAKIYFTIFILTLPVFFVAPSRLLGFITSGNPFAVHPRRFHLK